jgi:hypothetical protein
MSITRVEKNIGRMRRYDFLSLDGNVILHGVTFPKGHFPDYHEEVASLVAGLDELAHLAFLVWDSRDMLMAMAKFIEVSIIENPHSDPVEKAKIPVLMLQINRIIKAAEDFQVTYQKHSPLHKKETHEGT